MIAREMPLRMLVQDLLDLFNGQRDRVTFATGWTGG